MIDLFGFKDGKHSCFEIKATMSRCPERPTRWQVIRLNWMKQQGFEACILRVFLRKQDQKLLLDLYSQSRITEAIAILEPHCDIEEFDLSNYQHFQDSMPSLEDIESYNRKGYWWSQYMKVDG
jgi:hypothetical protein